MPDDSDGSVTRRIADLKVGDLGAAQGLDVLRNVAVLRMVGHTSDEIAEKMGCARRTVARQLALITRILTTNPS